MRFSWFKFRLFSRLSWSESWIIKIFSRLLRWRRSLFSRKVFRFSFSNFLLFLRNNRSYFSTKHSCCSSFKRFVSIFFSNFWRARSMKFQIVLWIHKSHNFCLWCSLHISIDRQQRYNYDQICDNVHIKTWREHSFWQFV